MAGVSFQIVSPDSRVAYLMQNCLTLIRKNWSILSCRANIIRIDRRNLLKLINKHLGKHSLVCTIFDCLIVTFLYYQKCAKTHLQQCRHYKKFRGRTPRPPALSLKNLKNSGGEPQTTRFKVSRRGEDMFNVAGKHLVQEEGGEWRAEETRGGWALPQKVEHPQLKFLVAPLQAMYSLLSIHRALLPPVQS